MHHTGPTFHCHVTNVTNKNLWILVVSVETWWFQWKHSTTTSELWLPFTAVGTGRLPGRASCRFSPAEPRTKSTRRHELGQQLLISWSLSSLVFHLSVDSFLAADWLPSLDSVDSLLQWERRQTSSEDGFIFVWCFWALSGADESDLSGFCSVESRFPALTSVESFLQRHNSNY